MIYIMGTIAAGKTSLAKILAEDLQSPVYYEDVESNGLILNMLQKFLCFWKTKQKSKWRNITICFFNFSLSTITPSNHSTKCCNGLFLRIRFCHGFSITRSQRN